MKKRGIMALLVSAFLLSAITACGNNDLKEEMPAKDEGDKKQVKEVLENETDNTDPDTDAAEALAQYAKGFRLCDLSGVQFIYEEQNTEGFSYFQTRGLDGIGERIQGCLYWRILDMEGDGREELLTFYLQEGNEAHRITAAVYEYEDGQVIESASTEFLPYALGLNCDSATIRFMVKDEKYICMDSWQNTFVSADGVSINLAAYYYDGTQFVETVNFQIAGSDFYEAGKENEELLNELSSMGFLKSAAALRDRDVFHLYAADDGVEPLFKISLTNSREEDWNAAPAAVLTQIAARTAEEEFVLQESNVRQIEASELSGMSKESLRIARNEIYARYGWQFEDEKLKDYFYQRAWYVPAENVDHEVLSPVERSNLEVITKAEKAALETAEDTSRITEGIEGGVPLTAMELAEVSDALKAADAYGFLYSFYEDVRDVKLEEVFYTGAGIVDRDFSDSVRESYLKEMNKREFDTDFLALKEEDMDTVLKKRTGYGLSDMRNPLEWVYLEEQNAYCMEAGDTNYMEVSVTEGVRTEDGMYYILYENPSLAYTDDDITCMVVLKKQRDDYRFVSNERLSQ